MYWVQFLDATMLLRYSGYREKLHERAVVSNTLSEGRQELDLD
jgi:hypothetical protein